MEQERTRYLLQWYAASSEDEECFQPAREAFLEASSIFKTELTKDPKKKAFDFQHTGLSDVEKVVKDAQERYEGQRKDGKVRDRLQRFSQVIQYYGNIVDVFVQHHPEYVSLAWGTMKFVFVTFLNHEATVSALAKGLCQVASVLPRAELSLVLYPTERMKRAVAQLYAYILRFLIRAHDWYDEHWAKHLWHSISRPVELRFTGLIGDIESLSTAVDNLAMHGSRAEMREMHQKIAQGNNELAALQMEVRETKELIISLKSFMSGAFVNTNDLISDIQATTIVHTLPSASQLDVNLACYYNLIMRNKRLKQGLAPSNYPMLTPALRAWSHCSGSSLLLLLAPQTVRAQLRDLTVSLVHLIRHAGVPTFWALDSNIDDDSTPKLDSMEVVLRCLAKQAIQHHLIKQTEATASMLHARFSRARNVQDLVELLAICLRDVPVVYIIVDLDSQIMRAVKDRSGSMPSAMLRLFDLLNAHGSQSRIKVFTTSNMDSGDCLPNPSTRPEQIQVIRGLERSRPRPKGFGRPRLRGKRR
ncbi:hypothetical protein PT974_00920 [Cladobotryum mycophilum]|uniref:DUF7708 domain-containing protein n=1 Tax=Cladobotryum mycophilum TaxID=491253 RepID=A0ABR0T3F4_9HYPO